MDGVQEDKRQIIGVLEIEQRAHGETTLSAPKRFGARRGLVCKQRGADGPVRGLDLVAHIQELDATIIIDCVLRGEPGSCASTTRKRS